VTIGNVSITERERKTAWGMGILRKSSGIAAVTLGLAGLLSGGLLTPAAAGKETAKLTPTSFGLEASGYASKVKGGQVPTGSDKIAYGVVSCTNKAGMENANSQADGDLGNGFAFQERPRAHGQRRPTTPCQRGAGTRSTRSRWSDCRWAT
jgi:hypothetical protein